MSDRRDWSLYISDMLDCAEQILSYVIGIDHGIVWTIIQRDLTRLVPQLRVVLTDSQGTDSPDAS